MLGALLLALGAMWPASGSAQPTAPQADSIVLERSLCFGTCPAYRLSLARTGRVHFESRNPGDSGRTASDSIAPEAISRLLWRAVDIGFFDLPELIERDRRLCPDSATDHPHATVTIFLVGTPKRVRDYLGCYLSSNHATADALPPLRAFEAAIDSTAGSARWRRPARRP